MRLLPAFQDRLDSTARVTLGQAAVPLFGPWKFTVGDSPIDPKTGKPPWDEADFDDSKWETVDLTPKDRAIDPVGGLSGYVPGWTTKGHPGYWRYAWYRIRVQARQGEGLSLAGPADVDDAYQVFDNGELAGHFGDFTGKQPQIKFTEPKMSSLAQPGSHEAITGQGGTGSGGIGPNGTGSDSTGLAESTRLLAFRLWMQPETPVNHPMPAACTPHGCWARLVRWRRATRYAGWIRSIPLHLISPKPCCLACWRWSASP
jgi:hypothetical protein